MCPHSTNHSPKGHHSLRRSPRPRRVADSERHSYPAEAYFAISSWNPDTKLTVCPPTTALMGRPSRYTTRLVATGLASMSVGFFIMSRVAADAAYWGPIIVAMLCMASGLSLVTSPSTEAVMGSLPREKAGVGSAVNDLSREVGGVLGVAVTGSVFLSLYSPRLVELFTKVPGLVGALPHGVLAQARESVGAAYVVGQRSPAFVQPRVFHAVSESFMHGFGAACVFVSVMALVGSVAALRFLPARAVDNTEPTHDSRPPE